jgi:hypothetical protein
MPSEFKIDGDKNIEIEVIVKTVESGNSLSCCRLWNVFYTKIRQSYYETDPYLNADRSIFNSRRYSLELNIASKQNRKTYHGDVFGYQ